MSRHSQASQQQRPPASGRRPQSASRELPAAMPCRAIVGRSSPSRVQATSHCPPALRRIPTMQFTGRRLPSRRRRRSD
ncbi:unnamed protein product [Urochloa humidicola]